MLDEESLVSDSATEKSSKTNSSKHLSDPFNESDEELDNFGVNKFNAAKAKVMKTFNLCFVQTRF